MNSPSRRDVLKSIGSTGLLLAGGAGVASAKGRGRRQGASADGTIVDVAVNNGFGILVDAVTEAGLADELSGNRQLTVFAPTNAAFSALLDELDVSKEELLARDDLADILLYHVTAGRRYAASVVNAPEIEMLNGETVTVDGTVLNGGGLGGADIVATDIEASNGVVHVIDGVLLP